MVCLVGNVLEHFLIIMNLHVSDTRPPLTSCAYLSICPSLHHLPHHALMTAYRLFHLSAMPVGRDTLPHAD